MKQLLFFLLTAVILASACDDPHTYVPACRYDAPFPKQNKQLTAVLGEQLSIRHRNQTLTFDVFSDEASNTIIRHSTGDTLFHGTVSKFRNLYFFSSLRPDGSYWIHAVQKKGKLLYGLTEAWEQMWRLQGITEPGNPFYKLLSNANADGSEIVLHPQKQLMKQLYTGLLNDDVPDTIVSMQEQVIAYNDPAKSVVKDDPEELELLARVYPNPTTDVLHVDLQQDGATFQLMTVDGHALQQGQLQARSNTIDLRQYAEGMYLLRLSNGVQSETVRIMKAH